MKTEGLAKMGVTASVNDPSSTQAEAALAVFDRRDVALRTAIEVWAASTTGADVRRRRELITKKRRAVESFFAEVGKDPGEVAPADVQEWCEQMKREDGRRPAAATVYSR